MPKVMLRDNVSKHPVKVLGLYSNLGVYFRYIRFRYSKCMVSMGN